MKRLLATAVAILVAAGAQAQSPDAWIRKCQADDPELANSNGFRVCTELYVVELENQQSKLVVELSRHLALGAGEDERAGQEHLMKSQELWRNFIEEHCRVVQAVSGEDGPVGDAFPSCTADAFSARNKQLSQLLKAARER